VMKQVDASGMKDVIQKRPGYGSDAEFIAAYVRALESFLTRYGPGGSFFRDNPDLPVRPVTAVEIWTEPNFQYMLPDSGDRPTDEAQREALYAKLLPAAYRAVKQRWPTVRVVGFGAGGAGAGDMRFIEHVLGLEPQAPRSMDILSTHPYVEPVPPESDRVQYWGNYSVAKSLETIRKTLAKHGVGDMQVWYTECGWPVSQADGGHFPTPAGAAMVNSQLQAAYVCRMYALGLRLGVPRVHLMFATDTDNFNGGFFLYDKTWRPSAQAVKTMITLLPCPKLRATVHDGAEGWYAWTFTPDTRTTVTAAPVTMAFNVAGPKRVELLWSASAANVVDMQGGMRRIAAAPAGGGMFKLALDIGPCPVYLVPVQR